MDTNETFAKNHEQRFLQQRQFDQTTQEEDTFRVGKVKVKNRAVKIVHIYVISC